MQNLTAQQISEIKAICGFFAIRKFHGNRKYVGSLPVGLYLEVAEKRRKRAFAQYTSPSLRNAKSASRAARRCVELNKQAAGTPYHKVMVEGTNFIFFASPVHGLRDYNKIELFEKNEYTLRVMNVFNRIATR